MYGREDYSVLIDGSGFNRQRFYCQNLSPSPAADGKSYGMGGILKVAERGWQDLDDHLKQLMQELGNAINESLSDSDRIAAAIGEIKRAGYDVFLVLEATIGFNKRRDSVTDKDSTETRHISEPTATGRIRWTSQDQKFLRALKIAVDEEA